MEVIIPPVSGIEIDCRPARWRRHATRYIRRVLQEPLNYAEDYVVRVLDVPSTVRLVTPYQGWRSAKMQTRGCMVSATQFTLELSGVEVGRKKLETKDEEITTTSVHEMVHCIRASKYPDCNVLMENIASEGLAYYAQAQAQQDMFDMPRSNTVLDDELDGEAVLDHLYCEPRRLESVSGSLYIDNQLKSEWLYNSASKEWFHWGQRLGIWCVKSWIEDIGYDFSELMDMPADEMLAV